MGIVNDDADTVAHAQLADARGELLRRRQHVGQAAGGVGDLFDIEEDGAGDVMLVVLGAGIAVGAGQEVCGIDHPDIGCAQMLGQPVGADQRVGFGVWHRFPSIDRRVRGPGSYDASATTTRRFCLPLFSIFTTSTRPISPVRPTWVPPQG